MIRRVGSLGCANFEALSAPLPSGVAGLSGVVGLIDAPGIFARAFAASSGVETCAGCGANSRISSFGSFTTST